MATFATISEILAIIQASLSALGKLPVVGPEAQLAEVFTQILQAGLNAYTQATGAPLDLTKIPLETQVP